MAKIKTSHKILFAPLSALLHGIARLPFWVLYGIADVLFVLIYYIVGYRKKVVIQNLNECFPEKSVKERKKILDEQNRKRDARLKDDYQPNKTWWGSQAIDD